MSSMPVSSSYLARSDSRLMKPKPLKFSDVLHRADAGAGLEGGQQVVQQRVRLPAHGLHARRSVHVGHRAEPVRAHHPEIEHVGILEVPVEQLAEIFDAGARGDRPEALALLDLDSAARISPLKGAASSEQVPTRAADLQRPCAQANTRPASSASAMAWLSRARTSHRSGSGSTSCSNSSPA